MVKAVILAGGLGTRISEETHLRPKPMVEIGGKPLLWHILKIYSHHGIDDFVICCGYKGYVIKEYVTNYFLHVSDVTVDMTNNRIEVHQHRAEPWKVTLVDTGEKTMTGGRLKRVAQYLSDDAFCFTYGDGVGDIDITALIAFHHRQGTLATVTAAYAPSRFGALEMGADRRVVNFTEKPRGDRGIINGGFFVLSPKVFDLLIDDSTVWEHEPLATLAERQQLSAYQHSGFWHPMDTLRDKTFLEALWVDGKAPWKVWD